MIKILFLDIDGVLNSSPTKETRAEWTEKYDYSVIQRKLYGFDSDLVNLLKLIIERTECRIVFSSSWRYFKDHHIEGDDWRMTLAELLNIDQNKYFIGNTPDIISGWEAGYNRRRGSEIKMWLETHTEIAVPGNYRICVIDDEVCDITPVIPESHVVHTDMKVGISMKDVDRAVKILNGN